jgi:FAD/FMN-containing dehydrogenase
VVQLCQVWGVSATPALLNDLRSRAAYAEGAGIYRILPQAVAVPHDLPELQALVRWAAATGTPLVPRGAGSGMAGGAVGSGVVVDLSAGFGKLELDGKRRTARTGAAVTWAQLDAAVRPLGLRLPPDPSSGAFATCGGMVATNAAGPRSLRYGSVRRWVEGVEMVTADGEVRTVRRGESGGAGPWLPTPDTRRLVGERFPKTSKNSSGYALDACLQSRHELDLLIGAEGTLGIVTAVEWRLDPTPPDAAGVALGFADLAALGEAVPFLVSLNPSAVELLDRTLLSFIPDFPHPTLACLLLVEFERETAAAARGVVGDAVRGLKHLTVHVDTAPDRAGRERLWAVRREASPALARLPATQRSLQVVEDGCVPLEHLAAYIEGLHAAATAHQVPVAIFGHAGDGHVHVNALPDTTRAGWREDLARLLDDVTALLGRLGGTPSGEHGDGRLRAGLLERVFGRDLIGVFGDVKRAYDPRGICNPGVILPAADWAPLADLKVGAGAVAIPADIAARLRDLERNAAWATPKLELARTLAP